MCSECPGAATAITATDYPGQRRLRHEMLVETIRAIHVASHGCYGVRRMHAQLTIGMGIEVGSGQVHLIMKHVGVQNISGAGKRYISKQDIATHEDLVNRKFTATRENQLWCTDITEHPTREGKVYCCAVIDAYSGRIVGWAIDSRQTASLVLSALDMAIAARSSDATIFHNRPRRHFSLGWLTPTEFEQTNRHLQLVSRLSRPGGHQAETAHGTFRNIRELTTKIREFINR